MAKYVVEFSPPVKIKNEEYSDVNTEIDYQLVLAPFQKQTQVEFTNIKLKQEAVRFLTVINPQDKPRQFVLSPPNDGVYFDVYEFTLQPNSQRKLSITWQPSSYGNIRKLIRIEQVDSNRKYDFVILGNCNDPSKKKLKGATLLHSKKNNINLVKKQLNCNQKKIILNKTRVVNCKSERILLVENTVNINESVYAEKLQSPLRRQTFIVGEKENLPNPKMNILNRDTVFTISECSRKRPDKNRQDNVFNNHFSTQTLNQSFDFLSDDSLEKPVKGLMDLSSPLNNFCLTPLKSTENLLSPFNISNKCKSFGSQLSYDNTDEALTLFNSSSFKPKDASTAAKTHTPEDRKPTRVSVNLCNKFENTSKEKSDEASTTFIKNTGNQESLISPPMIDQSLDVKVKHVWNITPTARHSTSRKTVNTSSISKPKKPSYAIKNSPYYKCSPRTSMMFKNRSKQHSVFSPKTKCLRTPKLDKCDQYLKCLANPELVYHNNLEDPFLKLSQYYEAEWLNRQESDMIRWLNALLMPTDKLVDEEPSDDLEQAAVAWVEASKTGNQNKPMQLAIQKDLFVAQIYRQSPQQWSALRKATTNLITSTSIATVLSKLSVIIEKDLITVREDRQIHLDLSLKKKIIDLLKCYNPLWLRIGLEAIYGQIIHVKSGSLDLDGLGWFIRKNLFNNDFVKKNFTKTNVLQVNLPLYNIAMKKFILRKVLMLIYFLDCAKEQHLIRHNPCLFKIDSPYKSSYDFLMGFCADMVTAHGDIVRRMRSIGYNLVHKQTHLHEVNYAVKSLNDLRDGTRITRFVEILFKGDPLSEKLRLPAISKLQKIYNVGLALTRISEHITIEGNISSRDIVNGHREKMLSLFWQIIYKYLTPRYNKAAIKIQTWWRNSGLKLVVMKRIRAKKMFKRHLAATKIQKYVRGYLTRKKFPQIQAELIENREKLHIASTVIKRYLQNKLKLLTEERKRFVILRKTTVFIQRKFKAMLAMKKDRMKYLKTKKSALLIQRVFRGFMVRKNWLHIKNQLIADKIKRTHAINIIKRTLRKNLPPTEDELYYKKLTFMALVVQRKFRAKKLMKVQMNAFLVLKKSVIVLQRRFRARQAMISQVEQYKRLQMCTLKLQAIVRGYIVRKQWPTLSNELLLNKMRLINSSNIIKRALRRNLPLTKDRVHFLELKKSVTILQSRFRAMQHMKQQRKEYLQLKTVTLKLQCVIRGYILRKQLPVLRIQLEKKKLHLANCSNIIKRCLRKNLPITEDRVKFLKQKTAVTVLQTRFRALRAMRNEEKKYRQTKVNIIKLQSIVRGYIVRKQWPSLRSELQMNKMRLINSSNIIKRCLRKNLPITEDRVKFLKQKTAVTVLQTRFRALRAMRNEEKKYRQTKVNIIKLQSIVRGYIVRKQWPSLRSELQINKMRLINSSNIIKRTMRRNLPLTEDRVKFLKLKNSAAILQSRFRAMRDMKDQRKKYLQLKTVTVKLQSVARGYIFRKQWPILQIQLQKKRLYLINCSNIIKRCFRKNLPVTEDRKKFLEVKFAAITLQRRFRAMKAMRCERKKYSQLIVNVIKLQSMARGYILRKRWPVLQNELILNRQQLINSSNIIKKALRKNLPITKDRLMFLKLRKAVIAVQSKFRANKQEKEYQTLRNSVILIQRRYRANIDMKRQKQVYFETRTMTIKIQAYFRGCLVRKKWPIIKQALIINRRRLIMASNIIKRFLRQCLPVNLERLRFLRLKQAVINVQARYRANVAMKIAEKQYRLLKSSTITMQRIYRANRAMLVQKKQYTRVKKSTVVLQTHVRGYLARKRWLKVKKNLEIQRKREIEALESKRLLVGHAFLFELGVEMRAAVQLRNWARNVVLIRKKFQRENVAASKIQAVVRGFLLRKRLPQIKYEFQMREQVYAATLIQAQWRGYCVRKRYQCRRETIRLPKKGALTLGRRHNDVMDMLNKQKRNEYSYRELATVFWNLDTCTTLSKELCVKTSEGMIVDYMFHFLQYSNQSQPSIEAREPVIRVLTNLLKYHETSWHIWMRTLNADMVKEMIKMMKTCCGKIIASKLYCAIATWLWIALQDPVKREYIKNVPIAIVDLKFMLDTLNKKYKTRKADKKKMVLPSTRPTWSIGSKCQKCFDSDLFATVQICKMLNIR